MAKKKEKTLEEKLQEALVPENQWPYILPENWCWLQISKLYDVGSSKRIHKSDWIDKGIPFIRTRELVKLSETGYVDNDLFISELLYEELKAKYGVPKCGDILISGVGTIGVPYIVKGKKQFYFKDGNVIWLKPKVKINASYIFWLYKSQFVINQIKAMSSGTTVDTYTITNANNTLLPIPPLLEQKRIVHRIESLFAKLDEAKEKIQQVLDGAEMRKAAILHKAFTGELTKTWRKENSVSVSELLKNISEKLLKVKKKKIKKVSNLYSQRNIPHEWTWVELDDIAYKITDGEHATPKRVDNFCGFYLLSARNVRNDELKLDYVDYVAEDEYIRISKRCNPHMGDVLISCSGSVGRCCVITDNEKYVMVRSAAVISPILCNPKFIMYMIMSRDVQAQIKSLCKQTAQANLFIGAIASIKIPLPSLEEQDYIADLVGELFYKEKCSVEHCSKILFDIDTMKKSILAKAFRGELGTNNPTEDSALNLLKEVLQDKS